MLFSGLRKQSDTTYGLFFMLISSSDHITGLTGKSGSVVVSLSKNGAGGGVPSGAISEVDAANFPRLYKVAGNATDSNTLGPLFLHAKDAASDPYDSKYDIVNYDPFTFKPPVTLAPADCSGNLPANIKATDNIAFSATQITSLSAATPAVTVSDKTGFSLSATGADLILKSSTFIQAIVAAINELATYGLTALNTLLVTTGIKAATIPAATLAVNQHVIVDSGSVTVSDKTGFALSSAGIKAIWDFLISGFTASIASIGNLLSTNLDVAVGTRTKPADTQARVALVDVCTLNSDMRGTDNAATAANLDTQLATIDGVVDAIKLKTDTLGGAGGISWTYTLTEEGTGLPIADANIWVTSDLAGKNIIASGKTDQYGIVGFALNAGTVYVWRQKTGYNFTNPDTEVVS